MSKSNIENERAAFELYLADQHGYEIYNGDFQLDQDGKYFDVTTERDWETWQAATDQANKKLDGCILVPITNEVVMVIENVIQQQCDASGVQEPLHRLDGWRILEEIAESLKVGENDRS